MPHARAASRIASLQQHLEPVAAANTLPTVMSTAAAAAVTAAPYKSPVTSHVLDTSRGCPAANMRVELHVLDDDDAATWHVVNAGYTNTDGRVASHLVPEGTHFRPGTYRMVFATQTYFEAHGVTEFFYPSAEITFLVKRTDQHYHVPLLINPFGYSTYRGS